MPAFDRGHLRRYDRYLRPFRLRSPFPDVARRIASEAPVRVTAHLDQPVTVRVPATSANLGPGFDALGVALDWTARITDRKSVV